MRNQNFYPDQYAEDKEFTINHNYLSEQFEDCDEILEKIKTVVLNNDFTLGSTVDEVEELMAIQAQTKYAIGVGSGTDALHLSLKAIGVGPGDEVITSTYTFYATVGAIVTAGAKPVFCDCKEDYNIDVEKIDSLITKKTKAIIPVHWSGRPCDMEQLLDVAKKYGIEIVEDACHALQAEYKNRRCGSFGIAGCFSFHPLKNLNVWGDGGMITTNSDELASRLRLIRNHGLIGRNECIEFSYNSRLDTIQAVVAKHLLERKFDMITQARINNALYLDECLSEIPEISLTQRKKELREVFHLYMFRSNNRDELVRYLRSNDVDAKIHYPIPMHLQPASKCFGYKKGDYPVAENIANTCISLPVHEFISEEKIGKMSGLVKTFYA